MPNVTHYYRQPYDQTRVLREALERPLTEQHAIEFCEALNVADETARHWADLPMHVVDGFYEVPSDFFIMHVTLSEIEFLERVQRTGEKGRFNLHGLRQKGLIGHATATTVTLSPVGTWLLRKYHEMLSTGEGLEYCAHKSRHVRA